MRFLGLILGFFFVALLNVGCSETDTSAGIEIGNPEVAKLGLTADFSIDYSDETQIPLAKSAAIDENFVIDTFRVTLTEVRSFGSFFEGVSVNPESGFAIWPYKDSPSEVMPISFTDGDIIENVNLQAKAHLREIGVYFQIERKENYNSIFGRVRVDGKYVPFVYELSRFQVFTLRYRYSQFEMTDSTVNLSVKFHVHRFVDGIDFASATVGKDGVIRIGRDSNEKIWEVMNERFVPSFQSLRYEYTNDDGRTIIDYVDNLLDELNNVFNKNIVTNGNFKEHDDEWFIWTQYKGKAELSVIEENDSYVAQVQVIAGGDSAHSVQLLHENIPVVKGGRYKFIFTIWSDVETTVTARLGSSITYVKNGFEEKVKVKKTGRSFEKEFTADVTDPFGRLDLNLGGKEATFWIKDVKIIRIK